MKVLLINGSPRQEGNTYTALNEVAKQLKINDIDSEIVWVGNKQLRGCIGCGMCAKNGNNRCIFTDDVCNDVIEKMETSDAVIIGSPVYWGQPSGQALCIQQRMLFAGGAFFRNKPAAAICVCRRGGATAAFQALQMPFQMCNMPIATSQYWNIAYGRAEGEAAQDAEGMQTMRTLADNMAWLLKKTHDVPAELPTREPAQRTSFIR